MSNQVKWILFCLAMLWGGSWLGHVLVETQKWAMAPLMITTVLSVMYGLYKAVDEGYRQP